MRNRKCHALQVPEQVGISSSSWRAMVCLALALLFTCSAAAQSTASHVIKNNTPGLTSIGVNMGHEDLSKSMNVTVWLHPRNQATLDMLAEQLYDETSPNYRQWLKPAQLKALFAPTDQDLNTVKQFLIANNLKISSVGPANFSVTAAGTVADVEQAFSVEIDKFIVGNEKHHANTSDPVIEGLAGTLVAAVAGLNDITLKQPVMHPQDILGGRAGTSANRNTANSGSVNAASSFGPCFTGVETLSFTTNRGLPSATYTGNGYGNVSINGQAGPPCGYDPQAIYAAYNLNALYAKGFRGQGQTIVIVNFLGAPTVMDDANVFNSLNNLPQLNDNNFSTIFFPFNCNCGIETEEIDLDVEWSHAIAPQANIVLVIAPSGSIADVDNATLFAVLEGLGNTISGSFGVPERVLDANTLTQENLIAELAAVSGISTNYSSGDFGDFLTLDIPPTISVPAGVPFATSVGGVTLATNPDGTMAWQAGWGTNQTAIVAPPSIGGFVADPPVHFGFRGGSGGGPSGFFAKPKFQRGLPGKFRQTPDISWLADPLTGGEEVLTINTINGNQQVLAIVGGTSLAAPMFSGLWAIANQEAGVPLGQAAQYLYSMPTPTITDVLPQHSATNPTGTIQDANGIETFTAPVLAEAGVFPLIPPTGFYSALFQNPFDFEWDILSFGTDGALSVTKGWDNVTGVGTPNGEKFADFFARPGIAK